MRFSPLLLSALAVSAPAFAEDVSYSVGDEAFTGYWAEAEPPAASFSSFMTGTG